MVGRNMPKKLEKKVLVLDTNKNETHVIATSENLSELLFTNATIRPVTKER
jgi:hypothetical protein